MTKFKVADTQNGWVSFDFVCYTKSKDINLFGQTGLKLTNYFSKSPDH